jgi:hypothetical protein
LSSFAAETLAFRHTFLFLSLVDPTFYLRNSALSPPTVGFPVSLSLPFVSANPINSFRNFSWRTRSSLTELPRDSIAWTFAAPAPSRTSDVSHGTETRLKNGAIAIVAGSVAVVALVVLLGLWLRRSRYSYSYTVSVADLPSTSKISTGLETLTDVTYENNVTWDDLPGPSLRLE